MEGVAYLREDLHDFTAASNLEFNDKIKDLIAGGKDISHFGFGQSPFPVPQCCVGGLKRHAHVHEYLPSKGLHSLREKIVQFHQKHDNFQHFHLDQVIFGCGSKEIIFLAQMAFVGDVLLCSPAWTYRPQTRLCGKRSFVVESSRHTQFFPTAQALEQVLTNECLNDKPKLLILNSPNNPTGLILASEEHMRSLTDVCRRHNVIVLSDEIYARLCFDGTYTSIAHYYPEGTIVTSGFSKWASVGGWRAGYGMFPRELGALAKFVASAAGLTFTCAPSPVQYALRDAMDHHEELDAYMLHMRKVLSAVNDFTYRRLSEAGIGGVKSKAGYYYMADFEAIRSGLQAKFGDDVSGQQMCDAMLEEAGVALMPCYPNYLRPKGELTTRLCFVNFDGSDALNESIKQGANAVLSSDFVRKYCKTTVDGIEVYLNMNCKIFVVLKANSTFLEIGELDSWISTRPTMKLNQHSPFDIFSPCSTGADST